MKYLHVSQEVVMSEQKNVLFVCNLLIFFINSFNKFF